MPAPTDSLEPLLTDLLRRFLNQNGEDADLDVLRAVAGRLRGLVDQHGLPPPVPAEADSDRSRLPDTEYARRAALAAGEGASPLLTDAARQLVKALFYPELGQCRSSFEAVGADGRCRRQDLERVRRRVSGTHCVDCPHWREFTRTEHRAFLQAHWHAGATAFEAHSAVFLPEDFGALRTWIAARRG